MTKWASGINEFFAQEEPTDPHIPLPPPEGVKLIQGFWDREKTVKVEMCGHCVRPIRRCNCPVVVELTETDLEAA